MDNRLILDKLIFYVIITFFLISCQNATNTSSTNKIDTITIRPNETKDICNCTSNDTSFQSLINCFDKPNCTISFSYIKFFPLDTIVIGGPCEILDTSCSKLVLKTISKHKFKNITILHLIADTESGDDFVVVTYDIMNKPISMFLICKSCADQQSSTDITGEGSIEFINDSTFEYDSKTQIRYRMWNHDPFLPIQEKFINTTSIYNINTKGQILKIDSLNRHIEHDTTDLSILDNLTKAELRFARNALYAKYDYRFKSQQMINYFKERVLGYEPLYDNIDEKLNKLDKKTLKYIADLEKKK